MTHEYDSIMYEHCWKEEVLLGKGQEGGRIDANGGMWLAKDDCQLLLVRGQLCLGREGGYKGTEGCVFRYMTTRDGRAANVRVALNECPGF